MNNREVQDLHDLMHTIRNATLICDALLNQGKYELAPTIVEYILENAQEAVDDYCVDTSV